MYQRHQQTTSLYKQRTNEQTNERTTQANKQNEETRNYCEDDISQSSKQSIQQTDSWILLKKPWQSSIHSCV